MRLGYCFDLALGASREISTIDPAGLGLLPGTRRVDVDRPRRRISRIRHERSRTFTCTAHVREPVAWSICATRSVTHVCASIYVHLHRCTCASTRRRVSPCTYVLHGSWMCIVFVCMVKRDCRVEAALATDRSAYFAYDVSSGLLGVTQNCTQRYMVRERLEEGGGDTRVG